ncbi:hypothetical protein HMPREF3227_01495 [Corynebacterium sp. CMW7794]|nr:hypothetical protein HMPREF3227_01495 [Corynebacterium sp. CMW7794]
MINVADVKNELHVRGSQVKNSSRRLTIFSGGGLNHKCVRKRGGSSDSPSTSPSVGGWAPPPLESEQGPPGAL